MIEIADLKIVRRRKPETLVQVDHLSFRSGESHVLVGRTGAGKSLIAKTIAGLPVSGISVSGRTRKAGGTWAELDAAPPFWLREIFLLPQEPATALDPTASIGSQIAEVLHWRRARDQTEVNLQQLAASVGLLNRDLDKLPHACSGGMLQRALIAMALAVDADLIICDEPTKGLDAKRRIETSQLLNRLKKDGRALFVITHDLALTRDIGDTLTVLEEGRVVESGRTADLLDQPASAALAMLIRSEPDQWPIRPAEPGLRGIPLVTLAGVGHRIGATRSLFRGIDLEIQSGEIVGLFGPSGAGKTTLADIALGLTVPSEGQVLWRGHPLSTLPRRERRQWRPDFAKLFQDPTATFPAWLTAGTVLRKLTPCRNDRYRGEGGLQRLLERLCLDADVLDRGPDALSGGEMQRLAIARTVLVNPAFLVCDEPSSRLDMVVQRQAVDLLVEFAREMAMGLLFITHDARILERIADRTFELRREGSLQLTRSPDPFHGTGPGMSRPGWRFDQSTSVST